MSFRRTGCCISTGAVIKDCAVETCSEFGVSERISVGDMTSLTWSDGENLAVFMVNESLNDNSYASSISLILDPVIEGGVMTFALNMSAPSQEHAFSILAQFCGDMSAHE